MPLMMRCDDCTDSLHQRLGRNCRISTPLSASDVAFTVGFPWKVISGVPRLVFPHLSTLTTEWSSGRVQGNQLQSTRECSSSHHGLVIMKRMTAGTRITLGLVCSMVGILMMAHYLGILPDREQIDIVHRQQTSETLALSAAAMLAQNDHRGLDVVLNGLVKRRLDLESVAVVSAVDGIVIEAGEHEAHWPHDLGNRSNDRYMQVPLARPDNPEWGRIELRYAPLLKEGFLSSLQTQFYSMLLFCAVLAFFAFRTFLRFCHEESGSFASGSKASP